MVVIPSTYVCRYSWSGRKVALKKRTSTFDQNTRDKKNRQTHAERLVFGSGRRNKSRLTLRYDALACGPRIHASAVDAKSAPYFSRHSVKIAMRHVAILRVGAKPRRRNRSRHLRRASVPQIHLRGQKVRTHTWAKVGQQSGRTNMRRERWMEGAAESTRGIVWGLMYAREGGAQPPTDRR